MHRTAVNIPLLLAILALARLAATEEAPLAVFRPSSGDAAVIRVDPSRTGPPISRRLFGKFTEHLHRNIYHGMWAQVVRNPGFEEWKYFFSSDEAMNRARQAASRAGRPWPQGLAAHWLPEGAGDVVRSLDDDRVNSEASQRIEIRSLETPAAGVRQEDVFLPLHRESDYRVSVSLRSRAIETVTLEFREGGRTLASARLEGVEGTWRKFRAHLRIAARVPRGTPLTLAVTASETGEFWIDQLLVFPADSVHGFDRDVVELCRRARLSLLRYPGGNFASGYHWRDGVGPVDRRPMRRNPAWQCPEYNHVGTDEFLAFCEAVGCEPLICINAGNGTAREAARWVEYANGPIESPLGSLRARHGHPRPHGVTYWEIGNELYGGWQVGHCSAEEYARRYRRFVTAMRRVDPDIRFIANGRDAAWHAPLLDASPTLVRSFSVHPLIGSRIPRQADPASAYRALVAHPTWYRGFLEKLAQQIEDAGVTPRLAITELQIFTNKRELPTNSTLAEAIFMARYFHLGIRLGGLVEMITHSALVNHGGGLRKVRGIVFAQPSWWATHLYGTMEGTIPMGIEVQTPVSDVSERSLPRVEEAPWIDAVALTDGERRTLTLMVINTHPDRGLDVTIHPGDWPLPGRLAGRQIRGPSFMSQNSWDDPDVVRIHTLDEPLKRASAREEALIHSLPPHSVTELVFGR